MQAFDKNQHASLLFHSCNYNCKKVFIGGRRRGEENVEEKKNKVFLVISERSQWPVL